MFQLILFALAKQLSLFKNSDDLVLFEVAAVVQVEDFEEDVDLGLRHAEGAVRLAVLVLLVEVLHQRLELLLVQEPVLVHVVLDHLHVRQEVLERHVLGEGHAPRLQVLQLGVHPRNVLGELGVRQENQQAPCEVLSADISSLIVTLILAEVIMPQLLPDLTPELLVLLIGDSFLPIENFLSDSFICCQKVRIRGFYMTAVQVA